LQLPSAQLSSSSLPLTLVVTERSSSHSSLLPWERWVDSTLVSCDDFNGFLNLNLLFPLQRYESQFSGFVSKLRWIVDGDNKWNWRSDRNPRVSSIASNSFNLHHTLLFSVHTSLVFSPQIVPSANGVSSSGSLSSFSTSPMSSTSSGLREKFSLGTTDTFQKPEIKRTLQLRKRNSKHRRKRLRT
jgi:hypothetical protein